MKYLLVLLLSSNVFAGAINLPTPINSSSPVSAVQVAVSANLQMNAQAGFQALSNTTQKVFSLIWSNQSINGAPALTPQQVFDSLKDSSGNPLGCAYHSMLAPVLSLLTAAAGSAPSLVEPKTVTCNSDGSVTVSP